jgi:hypothetical protein
MKNGSPTNIPPFFKPHDKDIANAGVATSVATEVKNPIAVYTKPNSFDVTKDVIYDLIAGPNPQPKTVRERAVLR